MDRKSSLLSYMPIVFTPFGLTHPFVELNQFLSSRIESGQSQDDRFKLLVILFDGNSLTVLFTVDFCR